MPDSRLTAVRLAALMVVLGLVILMLSLENPFSSDAPSSGQAIGATNSRLEHWWVGGPARMLVVRGGGFQPNEWVNVLASPSMNLTDKLIFVGMFQANANGDVAASGINLRENTDAIQGWFLIARGLSSNRQAVTDAVVTVPPKPTLSYLSPTPPAVVYVSPVAPTVLPDIPDERWRVSFFANRDRDTYPFRYGYEELSADPRRPRYQLSHTYGVNAPLPELSPTNFRAEWIGRFYFSFTDSYDFRLEVDGGARVSVDGQLLIDAWHMGPQRTVIQRIPLSAGLHVVTVDYFTDGAPAAIYLKWSNEPDTNTIWLGRYYAGGVPMGAPTMIRDDPRIDFQWGNLAPGEGVPVDNFSVDWERYVNVPATKEYTCKLTVDDRARIFVDGFPVRELNDFAITPTSLSKQIRLQAGRRRFEVQYVETGGEAKMAFNCPELFE